MSNIPEQLDTLLKDRKQNGTLSYSEEAESDGEIKDLVTVAEKLATIQFSAPTPVRQRKYILSDKIVSAPTRTFKLTKILVWPAAAAFAILITIQTYQYVGNSLPGSTLFPIKKLSERAELWVAKNNPQKLAQTQLNITERRLTETQIVLNSSIFSQAILSQALEELNKQTLTTLPLVKNIVTVEKSDSSLVQKLENLNQRLKSLPAKTENDDKSLAIATQVSSASQKTTEEVLEIIAASEEASLSMQKENSVQVNGRVTNFSENTIVVEKTTFTLVKDETIITKAGKEVSISDLPLQAKVVAKGVKTEDGSLKATEIEILVVPAPKPDIDESENSQTDEVTPSLKINNGVQGTLLIEDPSPTTKPTPEEVSN